MPRLLRKPRQTAGDKEIGPRSSTKQRFIDATKTLLDIANESADAFPPLKSCLGGINALVKYYEGCKDVEDKLGELVIWLTKLKDGAATTSAGDNREEAERREHLERSLESIEKRSRMVLDKGKVAMILDKRKDSGVVVKLVEELRQAILLYQLSQQRSIDNQVAQLASSFSVFLKLHEKTPKIKEKTESTLARLGRLTGEVGTVRDIDEFQRKIVLFETLEEIKDELLCILERTSAVGYQETDADVNAVGELAEEVRDAVIEYQLAQQNAIHEQNCKLIDSADLLVLNNSLRAKAVEFCHGNRRGCLKGTRDTVLNEIESWARDFDKSPVFWLNGVAGTGKSTVAQTISERLFAEGRLGASFFCSRDFEEHSNLHFILPTLAFQLARKYPDFRSHFVSLLRSNPDVVHETLYNQMEKLIAKPLRETGISTVIVIDAIDECKDDEPSSAILSVLGRFVGQIPGVKFFITGRPEQWIKTGFRLPLLVNSTDVFVLHDVHPFLIQNDIRIFLKHELSELALRRQLKGWPSDELIDMLCRRAAGLFVYAVATTKFLDNRSHLPKHRLDVILKVPESSAPEGKTKFNSGTTLDSLYTSILQAAFSEEDPEVDSKIRTTVGTIVAVANPLPPPAIAELIGLDPEEVMLYLGLVQSLLAVDEDPNQPVKPFHKSFPDFITDPSRCTNPRFYLSPECLHLELATSCLRLMNEGLEQDLLSLPEYALNSEIEDLQTRIDDRISVALQYACRSWHNHLAETRGEMADVISYLHIFLEGKFLAWLEVLSVLGDVGNASAGLEKLAHWLQEVAQDSQLLDITEDFLHFTTKFFEPINISATHIYHSALELCPISSIVRKLYYNRCHGITRFPRVITGTPNSWDSTLSFTCNDNYNICTWSPCGRFIAAWAGRTVEIRNHLTLELLAVFQSAEDASCDCSSLAYSPDGWSLACGSSRSIVIRDIQTGGVAREIKCDMKVVGLAWSLDGRTIAATLKWASYLAIYDVASGAGLSLEGPYYTSRCNLWACGESFRLGGALPTPSDDIFNISISHVGPPLVTTETLQVTAYPPQRSSPAVAFSPSTHRVSILGSSTLRIFDSQTSDRLLEEHGRFISSTFSPDGSFFAASGDADFRIWKFTSGSYLLWGKYQCWSLPSTYEEPPLRFSPTSSSILSWSRNVLQVRRLQDPPAPLHPHPQCAAISRSGRHIAIAHRLGSTVVIANLLLQTPSQFIDTCVEIEGLVITGNILLVASSKEVLAYLLTDEGIVDGVFGNRRASQSDSIWTMTSPLLRPEIMSLKVEGQVGVVWIDDVSPLIYHIETGDVLECYHEPQEVNRPWASLRTLSNFLEYYYPRYLDPSADNSPPPKDGWREAVWVTDPEGKHRFWVPFEWRGFWEPENWHQDITTLFARIGGQPLIIKF